MPYQISKRACNSKKMVIELLPNHQAKVTSKNNSAFSVTFNLPNFNVVEFNGIGASDTSNFLEKASNFARKNIMTL